MIAKEGCKWSGKVLAVLFAKKKKRTKRTAFLKFQPKLGSKIKEKERRDGEKGLLRYINKVGRDSGR